MAEGIDPRAVKAKRIADQQAQRDSVKLEQAKREVSALEAWAASQIVLLVGELAQTEARDRWTIVDTTAGAIPALMPPAPNTDFSPRIDAVPGLGQHTDAILKALNYSDARIAELRDAGVI